MPKIATAREVGQYLKLSDSTVYKLAASGEILGFKIGDSWRFDMDNVINLINKCKDAPRPRRSPLWLKSGVSSLLPRHHHGRSVVYV